MKIISFYQLSLALIPVLITLFVMWRWSINTQKTIHALVRMLLQLLLIGFVLNSIFSSDNYLLIISVLSIMLIVASWIALKNIPQKTSLTYPIIFISLCVGGLLTLAVMSQAVLESTPWYNAQILIPIGGMIFANSMNTISLAGERFYSELENHPVKMARNTAFQAAMIPITNSLFAVGLVSLPGMMTGQILSGTDPLIAVRYQIMVMCMILGSGGISTALFLHLLIKQSSKKNDE